MPLRISADIVIFRQKKVRVMRTHERDHRPMLVALPQLQRVGKERRDINRPRLFDILIQRFIIEADVYKRTKGF